MKIKLLKFQAEDIQNINGIIKSVVRNFRTVEIMKGMFKDISFSISSGIIPMLIKGIDFAHAGYGFIVGYFYNKSLKTGKISYRLIGFLISWILHGLFDFGLSEEFVALNDNLVFISLGLTLVSIITIIMLIRYVKKEKLREAR